MRSTICDQCSNHITKDDLCDAVKIGMYVFCCEECRDLWAEDETEPLDESDLNDYEDDDDEDD